MCTTSSFAVALASTVDMSLSAGSKWKTPPAARRPGGRRSRRRRAQRRRAAGRPRWRRPWLRPGRAGSTSALLQAATVSASASSSARWSPARRSTGRLRRCQSSSTAPAAVQMLVTRMRFSVRVPVLSVQITVVEPSVSTALSRLTSAPRRASTRTPTASASVIVGSSPSGTLATKKPDGEHGGVRERQARRPACRAAGTRCPTATRDRGDQPRDPAHLALERALVRRRPAAVSAAMRPSSVRIPVANTTASASPPVHTVPLNTRSRAWRKADVGVGELGRAEHRQRLAGQRRRRRARASPSSSRASAEMRSPSAMSSTSPGTRVRGVDLAAVAVAPHGRLVRAGRP